MIEYLVAALDKTNLDAQIARRRYARKVQTPELHATGGHGDLMAHVLHLVLVEECNHSELTARLEAAYPGASGTEFEEQLSYMHLTSDERIQVVRDRSQRMVERIALLDQAREESFLERQLEMMERDYEYLTTCMATLYRLGIAYAAELPASHRERWERLGGTCSLIDSRNFLRRVCSQIVEARRLKQRRQPPGRRPKSELVPFRAQEPHTLTIPKAPEPLMPSPSASEPPSATGLLGAMNTPSYDHLLDKIAAAAELCRRYRRGEAPAEDLAETLSPLVGNLEKFLRHQGIRPILAQGEIMRLTLEESLQYDYQGSEFEQDPKEVEVLGPGWEHQGARIARPRVRELHTGTVQG